MHEDQLRWALLQARPAQAIIRLFRPDDIAPADKITTTLAALANELDIPADAGREAVAELVRAPDFSADIDPATCPEDGLLTIVVDWHTFHATRIDLRSPDA